MGSKKLEMRILNAHIPFPISKFMAFEENNWIGPREVGNETQTRILIFEILPSGRCNSGHSRDGGISRMEIALEKKWNFLAENLRELRRDYKSENYKTN